MYVSHSKSTVYAGILHRTELKMEMEHSGFRKYPTASGTVLPLLPYSVFCLRCTRLTLIISLRSCCLQFELTEEHMVDQMESLLKNLACEDNCAASCFPH